MTNQEKRKLKHDALKVHAKNMLSQDLIFHNLIVNDFIKTAKKKQEE